jgi:serine protease Do
MNAKSIIKVLLGGAAVAATPFVLVRADLSKPAEKPEAGGIENQLRRFLEGLGSTLNEEQRKDLDKALDEFQEELKENPEPGKPRQFKWEFRNDGSEPSQGGTTPKKRGKVELAPDRSRSQNPDQAQTDPLEQMREQMRRSFPGMDLDDFLGPFMRDLNRMQQQQQRQQRGGAQEGARQWFQGREENSKSATRYEKAVRRAKAEFRPVIKEARSSVVTLYGKDGEQLALATIVTADGYALTKASALGDTKGVEAEFADGRVVSAKVADTVKAYDLALVKLDARDLKPIQWNPTELVEVGTLVAAPSSEEDPLAIGVVSVCSRCLDSSHKGFLGVGMDAAEGGVKITHVTEKSAAQKAGLKAGDIITAVDGKPVKSPLELTSYITRKKAEDEVHIGYRRDKEDKVAVATLQSRDDAKLATFNGRDLTETELKQMSRSLDPTARMGGRGSAVADGFPLALQTDLLLEPNECGGPAVDIDGKAVGINIARAERTKTYAIPANALIKLLETVNEGKLSEQRELGDLKRDARQALEEVDTLESQLKEARERARSAREALEKKAK